MEISEVRNRVTQTIERARRGAADRRLRNDAAGRAFESLLADVAMPLFKQIANVLKIENYPFTVFTPSGSVRLMSDRSAQDFIELSLDTAGDAPQVICHTSRARGGHVVEAELVVGSGAPDSITDQDLLAFLLKELEPYVER